MIAFWYYVHIYLNEQWMKIVANYLEKVECYFAEAVSGKCAWCVMVESFSKSDGYKTE